MKKRAQLIPILLIIATSFISAADFAIGNTLNSIDFQSVFLMTIFVVVLAGTFWGASKVFSTKQVDGSRKTNKAIAAPVALALSFFAVYGANKYGLNFLGDFSPNFSLFEGIWGFIIPIVLLIAILYLVAKLKLESLLAAGIFFLAMGLTNMAFESDLVTWWGAILIGLYVLLKILSMFFKRKRDPYTGGKAPPPSPRNTNTDWKKQALKNQKEAEKQRREAEKNRERAQDEQKRAQEESEKRKEEQRRKWAYAIRQRIIRRKELLQTLESLKKTDDETTEYIKKFTGNMRAFVQRQPQESDEGFKERYKEQKLKHKLLSQAHERRKIVQGNIKTLENQIQTLEREINKLQRLYKQYFG